MVKRPGNSKYVKQMNRMLVLNIIKEHELVSRQQLAKLTGLTAPAITGIIREFLEMGFIKEVGLGTSSGGRKPVKIELNSDAGYVIGIEVTRYETLIGIADLKNDPTDIKRIDLDMSNPEQGMPLFLSMIRQLIDSKAYAGRKFLGIGLAFPGLLDVKEGCVTRSINLGPAWSGFPLTATLEKALGLPVFLENNSKAAALAERWFGGGTNCSDLVYVNLGEGISAGIIMDDRILRGFAGHAGQIGHVVVLEEGPRCNCGNRGCLEAIYGIPALVRKATAEMHLINPRDPLKEVWVSRGKIGIEDILSTAEMEGSYSWNLLQQVGNAVGLVLANVINLYNPEVVFMGGKLAVAAKVFIDCLQRTVDTHTFPEMAKSTQIRISALGMHSCVIGSCALVLQELFKLAQSDIMTDYQLHLTSQANGCE